MSSLIRRILNYFFLIHKDDPIELRKKKILNIFLLSTEFIAGCVILIYFIFLIAGAPIDGFGRTFQILLITFLAALGGIISFIINNYISTKVANINCLVLITFFIFIADSPYELVLGRSLLLFVLPIIMAGFLIKPFGSFIMSFIIISFNLLICLIEGFIPSFISLTIYVLIAFMTWFSAINFEKSIEKYREAYKRENFYKDLFVHDTNNILQNILMSLEIHEQKLMTFDVPNETRDLNLIKTQIDRWANLSRNIRNLNLSSESKIKLKNVDFEKVLEKSIRNIKSQYKRKEININIVTGIQKILVIADKFLIDILENILVNSVIHNDNNFVEILIKISKVQKDEKQFLKVEFIDNGIGIPDSRKINIFKGYDEKDKSLSGLGVGLSLVKNVLDRYKANIWVENKFPEDYSKGSNFILLFPEVVQ